MSRTKELEAALAYADDAETNEQFDVLCHKSAERKDTVSECVQYILAAEVRRLEADKRRLDWLAAPNNMQGQVLLPSKCVKENISDMRAAIDAAMLIDQRMRE